MAASTPLVVLGEIRSCLLPSAAALGRVEAGELLALMPGRAVRWRERPGSLAISPTIAVGVDCDLRLGTGTAHIVGTVATNVVLAGGRLLQSSAHTRVVRARDRRRQAWSHYVSRVGVTEVINRVPERAAVGPTLVEGFLADRPPNDGDPILDLASISERLLARIRSAPTLDQEPPMRTSGTRLRWTALVGGSAGPRVDLVLDDEFTRSVRLIVRTEEDLAAAQRFCEDLAAHDWLLSVTAAALEQADRFGSLRRERLDILSPVLEYFTGLWMPGAHTPAVLRALWRDLQSDPGLSRQWNTLVDRLRDSIAVATLNALRNKGFDSEW